MHSFFHRLIDFTATPSLLTPVLLMLWCAMGEALVSIPYVLESFWIVAGYSAGSGAVGWWYIIVLWIASQAGRQAGSITLYGIARLGIATLDRFFHKIHLDKFFHKIAKGTSAVSRMNLASPFTVAAGRMIGLRVPMMLVMAGKKRLGGLALGVLMQSLIWDWLYIAAGAIFGSTVQIEPAYLLLISFGMMAFIWLATWLLRKLFKRLRGVEPVADPEVAVETEQVTERD